MPHPPQKGLSAGKDGGGGGGAGTAVVGLGGEAAAVFPFRPAAAVTGRREEEGAPDRLRIGALPRAMGPLTYWLTSRHDGLVPAAPHRRAGAAEAVAAGGAANAGIDKEKSRRRQEVRARRMRTRREEAGACVYVATSAMQE